MLHKGGAFAQFELQIEGDDFLELLVEVHSLCDFYNIKRLAYGVELILKNLLLLIPLTNQSVVKINIVYLVKVDSQIVAVILFLSPPLACIQVVLHDVEHLSVLRALTTCFVEQRVYLGLISSLAGAREVIF